MCLHSKDASHHPKPHRRIISDSASACREGLKWKWLYTYRCAAQRSFAQPSPAQLFSERACVRSAAPTALPFHSRTSKNKDQEPQIHDASTSNPEKGGKEVILCNVFPKRGEGIIVMDTSRIAYTPHSGVKHFDIST